ncbi:MAG: hypothetical protein KC484_13180 [Colwelliaceae bacterium]|jgi:hypothetical protein|nr:hypothetical protein [Colwelliaceae bacterium]
MEERKIRDALIERRAAKENYHDLWESLTLAQKFSASSLAKYGYELGFIRCSSAGNVAIMVLNDNATTISSDGDINTAPDIKIR